MTLLYSYLEPVLLHAVVRLREIVIILFDLHILRLTALKVCRLIGVVSYLFVTPLISDGGDSILFKIILLTLLQAHHVINAMVVVSARRYHVGSPER